MKVFILSLCVFVLLIGMIVGNCIYVSKTADHMEQALLSLPTASEADAALTALEEYWHVRRTEISFSISFSEITEMDNYLIQLRTAAEHGEDYEFELARMLAIKNIEHMRRLERFSWECII